MSVPAVILLLIGLPVSVYFSVKFGRYAYLKATQLFQEEQQRKSTTKPSNKNE